MADFLENLPQHRLLNPTETAELLGVTLNTLRAWRSNKKGPTYVRLDGFFIRYSPSDLQNWLERFTVTP